MFAEALFTIANTCRQVKCPLTDEWIRKCGIYIQILATKYENLPFVTTWLDLESIMLSEISQRKTNDLSYMLNLKNKGTNKTDS